MMDELMDYTPQKNFDFFRYRYDLTAQDKQVFLNDCQKVLEGAHATVLEMLKLGARLAKIKRDGSWKEVVDPETKNSFNYLSFQEFAKYAFGFKPTRTSNLLSLAEFVELDEIGGVVYKDARYRDMNMSQLIELAPLPPAERELFTADLSVKKMQLCKRYMDADRVDWRAHKDDEDFDLYARAQAWEESENVRTSIAQANKVDEELRQAAFALGADPDVSAFMQTYYGAEPTDDEEDDEPPSDNSDVGILEGQTELPGMRYNFSAYTGVRRFLADFEDWERLGSYNDFFDCVYRWVFKNGTELCVAKCTSYVSEDDENKTTLFFFLALGVGITPIKIGKRKLENWIYRNAAALQ